MFTCSCSSLSSSVKNLMNLTKSLILLDEDKLNYFISYYKSFYFLAMIFSACCLLFLIHMFFEILDYILFHKIKNNQEKEVLVIENMNLKKEKLRQIDLNKNYQKKIKKLQKELLQSYD